VSAICSLGLLSFVLKELATDDECNAIDALLLLRMRDDGRWSEGHRELAERLLRFARLRATVAALESREAPSEKK